MIELSLSTILLAIGAGLTSVASPCVFPVIPIIVTGTKNDHKYRPLMIVAGLSITFILMGVLSSLFGSFIAGKMLYVERIAGGIVLLFGILMLADINLFKKVTIFNNINSSNDGKWSGFIMGLTLGLVWIPCVGPMLSGVLTMVATNGQLLYGIILLMFYSLGFAIPMLIVGYSSQALRQRIRSVQKYPFAIRIVSGSILILFGLYILLNGILGFGW